MKKWIIFLIIIVILAAGGCIAFHHFVMYHTLDKGGMENPNYTDYFADEHKPDEKEIEKTTVRNETETGKDELQVSVQWAEGDLTDCEEFIANTSEEKVRVMFTANRSAKDFKLLSLTIEEVNEKGEATYAAEELYSMEELTPMRPLAAEIVFYGDIPNCGISYIDENGVTRNYTVEISGEDGSVLLNELTAQSLQFH